MPAPSDMLLPTKFQLASWRRSPQHWLLATEALVRLLISQCLIQLLSDQQITRLLGTPETEPQSPSTSHPSAPSTDNSIHRPDQFHNTQFDNTQFDITLRQLDWAISAAERRIPWPVVCLPKAMAAKGILKRKGIHCLLCLGTRREDGNTAALQAHAWVRVDQRIVVGRTKTKQYAQIVCFN